MAIADLRISSNIKGWIYTSVKCVNLSIYAYILLQKEKITSETQSLCEQAPDDKSEHL